MSAPPSPRRTSSSLSKRQHGDRAGGSPTPIKVPALRCSELDRQPLILLVNPLVRYVWRRNNYSTRGAGRPPPGREPARLADALACGRCTGAGDRRRNRRRGPHRTSILPLVLAGVGHAVMPSSWVPLAHKSGPRTLLIEPVSYLDVAVLQPESDDLTPAARSFLAVARLHAAPPPQGGQTLLRRIINRLNLFSGSDLGLGRHVVPARLLEEEGSVTLQHTQRGGRHMSATQKFSIASIPADGVGKEVRLRRTPGPGRPGAEFRRQVRLRMDRVPMGLAST